MLSLAGLGLIAGAIAAMFGAVSYGTTSEQQIHALISQRQAVTRRVSNAIRDAREVLDQSDDSITLWTEDKDNDGKRDNDELKIIKRDADQNRLVVYTGQSNQTRNLDDLLENLVTAPDFTQKVWAERVTGFTTATTHDGRLVSYRMGLRRGQMQETAISAARLRHQTN